MDKTLETASNLATQLFSGVESVVNKYGPTVVDTVLWVTRIEAMNKLLTGFIAIGLLIVAFLYIKWVINKWSSWREFSDDEMFACQLGNVIGCVCSAILGVVAFICMCNTLFNIWVYVALVKPELYLAKQAVDKVMEVGKK